MDPVCGYDLRDLSFLLGLVLPDSQLSVPAELGQHLLDEPAYLHLQTGSSVEGCSIPPYSRIKETDNGVKLYDVHRADVDLLCDFTLEGTIEIVTNESPPGYCRLRDVLTGAYHLPISYVQRDGGDTHGPARQLTLSEDVSIDFVPAISSEKLSSVYSQSEAPFDWMWHDRASGWPTKETLYQIYKAGYHIVAAEHPAKDRGRYIDWRFSFSFAERALLNSCNVTQRKCYVLLKMFNNTYWKQFEFLKSYHLKNIILWACERKPQSEWTNETIGECLLLLLDDLASCIDKGVIQHYFFQENNLLACVSQEDCQQLLVEVSAVHQNPLKYLLMFTDQYSFLGGIVKDKISCLIQPAIEARHLEGQQKVQVFSDVATTIAAAHLQESSFWMQFAKGRFASSNTSETISEVQDFILHNWNIKTFDDIPSKILKKASTNTNIFEHFPKLFDNIQMMPDRRDTKIWDRKNKMVDNEDDVIFGGFGIMDALIALFVPPLCYNDIVDCLKWYGSNEETCGFSIPHFGDLVTPLVKGLYGHSSSPGDADNSGNQSNITPKKSLLKIPLEDVPTCIMQCKEKIENDLLGSLCIEFDIGKEVLHIKTVKRNFRKWDVQSKQVFDMSRMVEDGIGDKSPTFFDRYLECLNEYAGPPEERIFFFMSKVCGTLSPWDAVACYIHYYTEQGGSRDISFQLFDLVRNLYGCPTSVNTAALGFLKVIHKYWPEENVLQINENPLLYIVSQIEKSNLWHSIRKQSENPVRSNTSSPTADPYDEDGSTGSSEGMTVPLLTARKDRIKQLRYILYEWEEREYSSEILITVFCDFMMQLFYEYNVSCDYQWDHPAGNKSVVLMRYLIIFVIFSINPQLPPQDCLEEFLSVLAPEYDVPCTTTLWHVTSGLLIYSLERTAMAFLRCILSPALPHAHRSDCIGAGMEDLPGPSGMMLLVYDLELHYGLMDIPKALELYLKSQYPRVPIETAIKTLLGDIYGATIPLSIPLSFSDLVSILQAYSRGLMYIVERSAHLSFSFPHGTAVLGRHIPEALMDISIDIASIPVLEGILRNDSIQDPGFSFTDETNGSVEERVINIINGHSDVYKLKTMPGNFSEQESMVINYLEKELNQFERTSSKRTYKIDLMALLEKFKDHFCSVKQGMLTILNAILPGAHPCSQAMVYMMKNDIKDIMTFAGLCRSLSDKLQWETSDSLQEEPDCFCQLLVQCFPDMPPLRVLTSVLVPRDPSSKMMHAPASALSKRFDTLLSELFPDVSNHEAAEQFLSLWNSHLPQERKLSVPGQDKYLALVLKLRRLLREGGKQRSTTHHLQLYFLQELDFNLREYGDHYESQSKQCSIWHPIDLLWEYLHDAYRPTTEEWGVALLLLLDEVYPGEEPDEATLHLVKDLNPMHEDPIDISSLQPAFDTLHGILMSFG